MVLREAAGGAGRKELRDYVKGEDDKGAAQLAAGLNAPLPEKLGAVCVLLKIG